MKQVIIGTFDFGCEYVQLVLREGQGGEFYTKPEKGHIPRIKIGADYSRWHGVVQTLLHEAMELAMLRQDCRYEPDHRIAQDTCAYVFMADHAKFSECCAVAGVLLADSLPTVAREWKKWNAPVAKKKKKGAR